MLLLSREAKKQLWLDSHRWAHDRFDLHQQGPKAREELVAAYGFDIREHAAPPEAVAFSNKRGRFVKP